MARQSAVFTMTRTEPIVFKHANESARAFDLRVCIYVYGVRARVYVCVYVTLSLNVYHRCISQLGHQYYGPCNNSLSLRARIHTCARVGDIGGL